MKLVDFLKQSAQDLVTLLKQPPSTICPSLQAGDPVYNSITKLAEIFDRKENFPTESPPISSPRVEKETSSPRVKKANPSIPPPRVQPSTSISTKLLSKSTSSPSTTTTYDITTKDIRENTSTTNDTSPPTHSYFLRKRQGLGTSFRHNATQYLAAQHVLQSHL